MIIDEKGAHGESGFILDLADETQNLRSLAHALNLLGGGMSNKQDGRAVQKMADAIADKIDDIEKLLADFDQFMTAKTEPVA